MKEIWKLGTIVFTVLAVALFIGYAAAGGDIKTAKKNCEEMVKHGDEMIEHGKAGHLDIMSTHGKAMIDSAKKALDAIPSDNTHGKEAATHIQEAITHADEAVKLAGAGKGKDALTHADTAVSHAKEGNKHAQGM